MTNLLFIGTEEDESYLPRLKPLTGSATVAIGITREVTTFTQVALVAKKKGCTGILTTHPDILAKLTPDHKGAKISEYSGSYFRRDDLDIVILDPLQQLMTVSYGSFLAGRYISKLVNPERWMEDPEFSWEIASASTIDKLYSDFSSADLIAIDTETFKENLCLRCVGYCGVWFLPGGGIKTHTIVLPLDAMFFVLWMRKFNALPVGKILQNGKYDHAYFFRYNAPVSHWFWDTANCMHSWYAELPKDLGFLASFFRRTGRYWKSLASTASNLEEYYLYNARDCYNTALCFLAWIRECPVWATSNYVAKFPVNFPSHMGEMRGVARDESRRAEEEARLDGEIAEEKKSLSRMIGVPDFNPNSPKQVKLLLVALGCADIASKSSDEKSLKKAMYRHPLNRVILQKIINVRERVKLKGTYFPKEKEYGGRLLYASTPYATDTGRGASGESAYWCGINIQTIPAYTDAVKRTIRSDDGFAYAEADFSQAETKGTAYLTGDSALLAAVNGTKDFHSLNASAFFAVPYEEIYDDDAGKKLNKPLRDLSKRVNHGANYLMMEDVLIETMGLEAIFEAARILKLPTFWTERNIARYLLKQFEETYPTVRKDHPEYVQAEIKRTRLLVGPTGWTRYCFKDPFKNKRDLNSYTAHRAQSLNAMILDMAVMRVFYAIMINPQYQDHFKFIAQIHDSILFQYRIGHEYLCDMVADLMRIPVKVKDIKGIEREMIVPADVKKGLYSKEGILIPALYWSDTGD